MSLTKQQRRQRAFSMRAKSRSLGLASLILSMCMMLPGCSNRTVETVFVTKTEYVLPPEEYLIPTQVPRIDAFERTNDGLAKAYLETKKALISANGDKEAIQRYLDRKKAEQAGRD